MQKPTNSPIAMKTTVPFLFCIVLLFTSCKQQKSNLADSEIQENDSLSAMDVAMQPGAYESFQEMMDFICTQTQSSIENPVYPDYYGGTYVNGNGKLVVLITKDTATTRSANEALAQLDKHNIIVQHCEHSYNQLKQIVDTITLHIEEKAVWTSNIGMYGINDINNRVSIYLFDDSELKRKELLNNLDSSLIEIGWCGPIEETIAPIEID